MLHGTATLILREAQLGICGLQQTGQCTKRHGNVVQTTLAKQVIPVACSTAERRVYCKQQACLSYIEHQPCFVSLPQFRLVPRAICKCNSKQTLAQSSPGEGMFANRALAARFHLWKQCLHSFMRGMCCIRNMKPVPTSKQWSSVFREVGNWLGCCCGGCSVCANSQLSRNGSSNCLLIMAYS